MIVGLDPTRDADKELQAVQLAHALVGGVEAHATRAEEAYRDAGAEPGDIILVTGPTLVVRFGLVREQRGVSI